MFHFSIVAINVITSAKLVLQQIIIVLPVIPQEFLQLIAVHAEMVTMIA